MSIQEKIDRLIEDRKAQAAKKDLTRKIKSIVRALGFEIICGAGEGGAFEGGFGYAHEAPQDDWAWELEDDNNQKSLPVMALESSSRSIGLYFDSLSRGVNLQIHYDEADENIKVMHDGIKVYAAHNGIVETYIPTDKWENHIDSLFIAAGKRVKIKNQSAEDDKVMKKQKMIGKVLDYLRTNWGV